MKFKPLKATKIKTYSIKRRKSKVSVDDIARVYKKGDGFDEYFKGLPDILGAKDVKSVTSAIVKAHKGGQTVARSMGAQVLKVGLSPLIIDLMERGIVNSIALNGAGIVHDFELAFIGSTSEDVDSEIGKGKFGMARETGTMLNGAINRGVKKGLGLGRSVGEMINKSKFPNKNLSILAAGARLGIPVTVHVAIGTDILHIHPQTKGDMTGLGSQRDFELFSGVVSSLERGVYLNIGSAVIMPEVFIKALTLARNLGHRARNFTTVNMDFINHYRPLTNVVRRPTIGSGKGYALTGHHELMVPLLHAAIIEKLG